MAANETDLLTCLLLGQKARGLQSVFYLFYFFFGGVRREEEILKSVSNVLLSSLSRSVLKMWVFLKFSAWSLFVRVS